MGISNRCINIELCGTDRAVIRRVESFTRGCFKPRAGHRQRFLSDWRYILNFLNARLRPTAFRWPAKIRTWTGRESSRAELPRNFLLDRLQLQSDEQRPLLDREQLVSNKQRPQLGQETLQLGQETLLLRQETLQLAQEMLQLGQERRLLEQQDS